VAGRHSDQSSLDAPPLDQGSSLNSQSAKTDNISEDWTRTSASGADQVSFGLHNIASKPGDRCPLQAAMFGPNRLVFKKSAAL
jgi:hypothetical protein